MKAIIYAGIGLFSAASIYGVTDYYNSKEKGSLKNLYKDVPAAEQEVSFGAPADRNIDPEDYSRARIDEPANAKLTLVNKNNETGKTALVAFKKKVSKTRIPKIRFSDFSRSALIVRKVPSEAVSDSVIKKH